MGFTGRGIKSSAVSIVFGRIDDVNHGRNPAKNIIMLCGMDHRINGRETLSFLRSLFSRNNKIVSAILRDGPGCMSS